MLRLNRKKGQSILMKTPEGHIIEVQILECNGNQVHLGIEAPRGVDVWREELFHIIMENKKAAKTAVDKQQLAQQLQQVKSEQKKDSV